MTFVCLFNVRIVFSGPKMARNMCYTHILGCRIFTIWEIYQNGGHLGFRPPQHLAQGGKSRKVDFYDCQISVSDLWKNQLYTFFSKWYCITLGLYTFCLFTLVVTNKPNKMIYFEVSFLCKMCKFKKLENVELYYI